MLLRHQSRISVSSTRDKQHMRKTIKIARLIEFKLYTDSESFIDYIDVSTLPQRITSVATNLEGINKTMNSSRNRTMDNIVGELTDKFDSLL